MTRPGPHSSKLQRLSGKLNALVMSQLNLLSPLWQELHSLFFSWQPPFRVADFLKSYFSDSLTLRNMQPKLTLAPSLAKTIGREIQCLSFLGDPCPFFGLYKFLRPGRHLGKGARLGSEFPGDGIVKGAVRCCGSWPCTLCSKHHSCGPQTQTQVSSMVP